jgi:hypothetical protein
MTTSKQKAIGSAAERRIAALLGGVRVGMDGGPVDVIVGDYLSVQVKNVKGLPSLREAVGYIEAMPVGRLRAAVVVERAGSGRRGLRTITFDLDEWITWHGGPDS